SASSAPDQSRADLFWSKRARARNEPKINREPQQSREPGDRAGLLHQDKMNRTAALDRDRAAPSSPASTANRMTATESLLPEIINDFFNKIGTKLPIQNVRSPVANGGKADNICSLRDLPVLTPSGGWAGRNLAPQRGAD